jgi:hypothetical protein
LVQLHSSCLFYCYIKLHSSQEKKPLQICVITDRLCHGPWRLYILQIWRLYLFYFLVFRWTLRSRSFILFDPSNYKKNIKNNKKILIIIHVITILNIVLIHFITIVNIWLLTDFVMVRGGCIYYTQRSEISLSIDT